MKFKRTFTMAIQVAELTETDNTVNVSYPMTVTFDISRNTLASTNTGRIQIYNLKEDTRKKIFHDRFQKFTYRGVVLRAGYEGMTPLPIIFKGNIISAYSYRRGPDWITDIEALDGGFGVMNGQVSKTFPSGTSLPNLIGSLLENLPNIAKGTIGDFSAPTARGVTLVGNSWQIVNRIVDGGTAFIDNEKANVLKNNEYIVNSQGLDTLNSDSGLLNTPRRYDTLIEADMLFEPRAVVGQKIVVESLETINNGKHVILGVAHRGTISGAVSGQLVTTLSLSRGTTELVGVN